MDMSERVADDFSRIYSNEWREARASLSSEKHEEEIIYLLMRIVRGVRDMCSPETYQSNKNTSVEDMTKEYIHHRLSRSIHPDQVTNPVRSYIHSCVKYIFAMCSMTDPLEIIWIPKGEVIDSERFDIESGKSGQICDWTVWPAVVRADGSLVRKGIVIPI